MFLWIPRTAGTSIFESLVPAGCRKFKTPRAVRLEFSQTGLATFGHQAYHELVEAGAVTREFDRVAWKFAIVRNPWDRAVSLYALMRRRGMVDDRHTFEEFARSLHDGAIGPVGLHNADRLSWCNPQVEWLRDANGGIRADFVGRYESIDRDFGRICEKLGLDVKLGHVNAAPHAHYRDVYTSESRAHVERFYREDIETFGYRF